LPEKFTGPLIRGLKSGQNRGYFAEILTKCAPYLSDPLLDESVTTLQEAVKTETNFDVLKQLEVALQTLVQRKEEKNK
jgi:hypothetical protein